MSKKRRTPPKRRKNIRTKKKSWSHYVLMFSGFALLLFLLFSLSLDGVIAEFPLGDEIALILITLLTLSFLVERGLKFEKDKIYEIFYSAYLALMLIVLAVIYWITYLSSAEIGVFRTFVILTHVIVFLYSLITIRHSEKLWFIVVSYAFIALITVIIFAFTFWTLSLFNLGTLQYSECSKIDASLNSENWMYFSSVTFYGIGYGDICPVGPSVRFASQIEVALGALINTILIGFIFWKIREKSIEEEVKKRKRR